MKPSSPASACSRRVRSSRRCYDATHLLLKFREADIFAGQKPRVKPESPGCPSWGTRGLEVCLFVGCLLTSQQQACVSQGRICSDNSTCCHAEIEVADQTFHLTQSQYTDTGPTSPSADPMTPVAWQGSHWSANF